MINAIQLRLSRLGVRARVVGIAAIALIVCLAAFNICSYYSIEAELNAELTGFGSTLGKTLAESSRLALEEGKFDELQQTTDNLMLDTDLILKIEVMDENRNVILSKKAKNTQSSASRLVTLPIIKRQFKFDKSADELELQTLANPKTEAGKSTDNTIGHIQLTLAVDRVTEKRSDMLILYNQVLLCGALAGLLVASLLSGNLSKPLRNALTTLRTIRDGKYSQQVEVTTRGEIGEFQSTINQITLNMDESIVELENKVTARTIELQKSRDAISKSDAEKRRLIQKVHTIVEDERKSIAAEIHDELNATLIAAKLSSQRILKVASEENVALKVEEIRSHAQNIIELTSSLYSSARNIVRRLRPEILDMLGLYGAINDMIENYNGMATDCHFSLTADGDFSEIPPDLNITVYRLVQEALSNVIKHAKATEAHVFINNDLQKQHLLVSVVDNGNGFKPKFNESGIGIIGMKERVYAFNGDFEIISEEGGGSTVLAIFPMTGLQSTTHLQS